MSILQFENASCKDCCKCVGQCPVKAIEVKNHQAQIIERDCILCGTCTVVCPQRAKHDVSDVMQVKQRIHQGQQVIASVAPSFAAYFDVDGIASFKKALAALGFSGAFETAEGAFLVKTQYEELVARQGQGALISSSCPAVNGYICRHFPQALAYLAPVATPMQAHGRLLRSRYPQAVLVFIGPCIAKKGECHEAGSSVDYALTFGDLRAWLDEENVPLERGDAPQEKYVSRMFPVSGGILSTMEKREGIAYLSVDGARDCMAAIRDIAEGKLSGCFVEMSFCQGGCVGGPSFRRRDLSVLLGGYRVSLGVPESGDADYDLPPISDISARYRDQMVRYAPPSELQIAQVFKRMGKESVEDELNCGMCGYPSCRDKAVAVIMGRAEISMCMPLMKKRAESFSDQILSVTPNAVLAVDLDMRVKQINQAACAIFSLEPQDVVGQPVSRLMDEFDFVDLVASGQRSRKKRTYLAEYNAYLDQRFFYDRNSGVVICIMHDITREKQRKNQLMQVKMHAANMADDIVEKHLRIVHEIASLLGESAADTKAAITELKKTMMEEDEG